MRTHMKVDKSLYNRNMLYDSACDVTAVWGNTIRTRELPKRGIRPTTSQGNERQRVPRPPFPWNAILGSCA